LRKNKTAVLHLRLDDRLKSWFSRVCGRTSMSEKIRVLMIREIEKDYPDWEGKRTNARSGK